MNKKLVISMLLAILLVVVSCYLLIWFTLLFHLKYSNCGRYFRGSFYDERGGGKLPPLSKFCKDYARKLKFST